MFNSAVIIIATFLLSACTVVGPDYVAPGDGCVPQEWNSVDSIKGADASVRNEELSRWWQQFHDPLLSRLINLALANNKDLHQARARLREARAQKGVTDAQRYPSLDATGAIVRSNGGDNSGDDSYSVGFDAGWEIDIFGGLKRAEEAAEANIQSNLESYRDVLVSLSAEVALDYIELRIQQNNLLLAEEALDLQQQNFDLVSYQVQAGVKDKTALHQAKCTVESSKAVLFAINTSLNEAKNSLAVLTGNIPGTLHKELDDSGPIPVISSSVTVGIPAETVRRRPDIRKAEQDYAAQTAEIGVATADLYPKFTLAGSIGIESLDLIDVFTLNSAMWGIGPKVSWNVFDAGSIHRNIDVQSAKQEEYLFAYEEVVLNAMEEVENALTAYAYEQQRNHSLHLVVDSKAKALAAITAQYQAGTIDYITLIENQQSLLEEKQSLLESDGENGKNIVRLYKALGGGWETPWEHGQNINNESSR